MNKIGLLPYQQSRVKSERMGLLYILVYILNANVFESWSYFGLDFTHGNITSLLGLGDLDLKLEELTLRTTRL